MSIIEWRLAKLMAERGVNYKMLGAATGMHPNTISKLKHNPPTRLEMTTLVLLCRALNCQPGDLLAYRPDPADDLNENLQLPTNCYEQNLYEPVANR